MAKSPRKVPAVREPLQVYLTPADRAMLDRAAVAAGVSRAEVLRLGLRSFSAQILTEAHPVEKFLERMAVASWRADTPRDAGVRHDEFLTDRSARRPRKRRPG